MRVKCLTQEYNTASLARTRTWTARSGDEGTNHEAQGSKAITNLSSSRSVASSIVTTNLTTYSKHTGRPGDYRFLLWKSEIRANTARGPI